MEEYQRQQMLGNPASWDIDVLGTKATHFDITVIRRFALGQIVEGNVVTSMTAEAAMDDEKKEVTIIVTTDPASHNYEVPDVAHPLGFLNNANPEAIVLYADDAILSMMPAGSRFRVHLEFHDGNERYEIISQFCLTEVRGTPGQENAHG